MGEHGVLGELSSVSPIRAARARRGDRSRGGGRGRRASAARRAWRRHCRGRRTRHPAAAALQRRTGRLLGAARRSFASARRRLPLPGPRPCAGCCFAFGRRAASDALVLAQAEAGSSPDDPGFRAGSPLSGETPAPKSPVAGKDIVARGVAAGPRVGEISRAFHRLWADAGFPRDAAAVEDLLAAAFRTTAPEERIPHAAEPSRPIGVNRSRSENT